MRGARIGIVVKDDVAFVDAIAQYLNDILHDLRHRAHEHGRGVGLGNLVTFAVENARPEIFGLANDRGIRHAVEDARHLFGDRVEGAADDPHHNGICKVGGFFAYRPRTIDNEVAEFVDIHLALRRNDRGGVVLLDDGRPLDVAPRAQRGPIVVWSCKGLCPAVYLERHSARE